ncbi:MAG: peptidase M13, partial [Brevundimonas sp.]
MSRLRLMACAAGAALLVAAPALAQTAPVPVEIPSEDQAEIGVFGFDLNGMDTSIKPGDDFNRYASGTYLANTPIPADKASYGVFDMLYDRSQDNLRILIDESAANPSSSADAGRIGAFYASFMDEAAVNALGASPLQSDLAEVRAADTHEKMAALMGRTQYGFGSSLFGAQTFEDLRDPDKVSAYVVQGGLGMPDRDYYLEESFATQKAAYRAYVEQALTLAGWTDPAASADAVLAFETAIAGEHWTQVQNRQIDKIYNPTTVAELTTAAPGFDWAAWATAAGLGAERTLISANNTAYPGMARIFAETPIATLQAWEAFHVVNQAAPYLSQPFVDARFEFFGKTLNGQEENRPRWKRGVTLVDGSLGESLGREYVARHFSPQSKAMMEELVANLRAAMAVRIQNLDWMSDATKEQAL